MANCLTISVRGFHHQQFRRQRTLQPNRKATLHQCEAIHLTALSAVVEGDAVAPADIEAAEPKQILVSRGADNWKTPAMARRRSCAASSNTPQPWGSGPMTLGV